MLDFRPLVERFVDEVLQLIREASVDELRELLGDRRRALGSPRPPTRQAMAAPAPARTKASSSKKRREPPIRAASLPSATRVPRGGASSPILEITDPERLLAAAPRPMPPPGAADGSPEALSARGDTGKDADRSELPPRSDRTPTLRPDERLAHSSAAGIVIRRRKRE